MTSKRTPKHGSAGSCETHASTREQGKTTTSQPVQPLATADIAEQLAIYGTPPSSPLHLPLLSTPVRGVIIRLIDQEARGVPAPGHPPFPPSDGSDDGDVSYPSLVDLSSEWSRTILHRHPHTPPNTTEQCPPGSSRATSRLQRGTAHSSPCPLPITNHQDSQTPIDHLGIFDPLPLPEYAKVRGWLKEQLSTIAQSSYPFPAPPDDVMLEQNAPSTTPSSPSDICVTPPPLPLDWTRSLPNSISKGIHRSPTLTAREQQGKGQLSLASPQPLVPSVGDV